MNLNDKMFFKAKQLAAQSFIDNNLIPDKDPAHGIVTRDDFYVVWFSKTLQNFKAMVSTDITHGDYWEVTYNGDKKETYVDHYHKAKSSRYVD